MNVQGTITVPADGPDGLFGDNPDNGQSTDVDLYLGDDVQPRPVGNDWNGYTWRSIKAYTDAP